MRGGYGACACRGFFVMFVLSCINTIGSGTCMEENKSLSRSIEEWEVFSALYILLSALLVIS